MEATELYKILILVKNDACAMSYQSMAQYRTMVIGEIVKAITRLEANAKKP